MIRVMGIRPQHPLDTLLVTSSSRRITGTESADRRVNTALCSLPGFHRGKCSFFSFSDPAECSSSTPEIRECVLLATPVLRGTYANTIGAGGAEAV